MLKPKLHCVCIGWSSKFSPNSRSKLANKSLNSKKTKNIHINETETLCLYQSVFTCGVSYNTGSSFFSIKTHRIRKVNRSKPSSFKGNEHMFFFRLAFTRLCLRCSFLWTLNKLLKLLHPKV